MPNWCSNRLLVTGPAEELDRFQSASSNGTFLMRDTVPIPQELLGIHAGWYRAKDGTEVRRWRSSDGENVPVSDAELCSLQHKYGCTFSSDWCTENWGTKWDACDQRKLPDGQVGAWFDTAWSPPFSWVRTVSGLFPLLRFELAYAECGMGFFGVFRVEGSMEYEEYHNTDFYDENDSLLPTVSEHLQRYGLGTGG